MTIHPIHDHESYQEAVKRIESLMDAEPGTEDADELEILAALVHAWEEESCFIETPDPVEAIRFRMEQMDLNPRTLAEMVGTRPNRIYEILKRTRPLSLSLIRKLAEKLKIPAGTLIAEYPLKNS